MENKVDELKGMILETVKDGVKGVQEEVQKIKDEITKTNVKVDGILNTRVNDVNLRHPNGGKIEFIHNGFDLRQQGRNPIVQDKFLLLKNDNLKNEIAKMMIDAIKAGMVDGKPHYDLVKNTTLSEGTAGMGGYLVFDEFMNVIRSLGQIHGVVLNEAEVVTMNTDKLHYPVDNNKTITAAFKGETTDYDDGVPADLFTEIELSATRLGAYAVLTNQLIEDSGFDLVSFLMNKFAASISRIIDAQVFNAVSGSTTLDKLFDDAGILDSTGTLDIAHLLDAYSQMDARRTLGAKFYFHRIIQYGTIMKLKDDANNAAFPASVGNMADMIWKIPVTLVEDLPYSISSGNIVGLLANMKQAYVIGMRKGIGSFFFNPYSLDISEQTRITLGTRWAGKVGFAGSAVKLLYT